MSKTVKIKESNLVELIETVVTETVARTKKEWIAEQESKNTKLIEAKVREIAGKVISESKKSK